MVRREYSVEMPAPICLTLLLNSAASSCRRRNQEVAPEQGSVLGLDSGALSRALHPLGAAAAGAMPAQSAAARLQPALDRAALCGVGVGVDRVVNRTEFPGGSNS
jgi:hypothetical protein